jgi:phosphodiesterase/alkaline phosphatase D-like protein
MSRLLSLAITVWVSILTFAVQTVSQPPPAVKKIARMQIIEGPALESATHNSAIIRWKTNTGSSLIEHSVVHYGTDPKDLSGKAESLNRWNQNLPYMTHRVYVMNLTPGTTYYYTVESVRGDGTPLGGRSNTTSRFTTDNTARQPTGNASGPH